MPTFVKELPDGFKSPIELPTNSDQQVHWQTLNKSWWEKNPMSYEWNKQNPFPTNSKEYFLEIDRRFYTSHKVYMPWSKIPHDDLINFEKLKEQKVLEVGVGCGTHAQLLSSHAKEYTGIDLTQYAVETTTKRLETFGLSGKVLQMDCEKLQFEDNSFDFVWSWGVIHHSANTSKALSEIHRVLKPGGKAVIMVYDRNIYNYYFFYGFLCGILQGEFFKYGSIHHIRQARSDGALARYYSGGEWKNLVKDKFIVEDIRVAGSKSEFLPLPDGKLKKLIFNLLPNVVSRFFTNTLGFGTYLVSTLVKK